MQFLDKDCLSVISKYLSPNDLKNLKFAFPNLHLKAKEDKITAKIFSSINSFLNFLFTYNHDGYMLYNREYKDGVLIADLDYDEFARLEIKIESPYYKFIGINLIFTNIRLKIRNGHSIFFKTLSYMNNYDLFFDYIEYFISVDKGTYNTIGLLKPKLFTDSKKSYLADLLFNNSVYLYYFWSRLEKETQDKLRDNIKDFLKNENPNSRTKEKLEYILENWETILSSKFS